MENGIQKRVVVNHDDGTIDVTTYKSVGKDGIVNLGGFQFCVPGTFVVAETTKRKFAPNNPSDSQG